MDIATLIKAFGYIGVFLAIFLENSIPILFFLPGDALLLTAGLVSSQGYLHIEWLILGSLITSILGYMFGYHLGWRIGTKIFENPSSSRFISEEYLLKTRSFYDKYGSLSIVIARFLPLRACVVFVAGAVNMNYRTFMIYNVISAIAWAVFLPLAGYFLGNVIPIEDMKKVTLIPMAGITFICILVPVLLYFLKKRKKGS